MADYAPNRYCACPRCRSRALIGPTVLITLGVLFLIGEFTRYDFSDTWPVLLIVIGLAKVLASNASTEGHTPEAVPSAGPGQQGPPVPPGAAGATRPAGLLGESSSPTSQAEAGPEGITGDQHA